MKKILPILTGLLCTAFIGYSAPGDTTWVQANQVHLNYYNNFDTTVVFPDGSKTYRKIYMIFTMGQYNCGNAQYCHQWDYTVQNYLMTPGGDTIEMCRLITPFATQGWSRFGSNWKQPYVFDVTDFYPLLKDTATIRIHYSGYSGGFTADVKFAFIEGTPERDVLGISKLYDFSSQYGNAANPINSHFTTRSETAPTGTKSAVLKYLVTGHGSDQNLCCEFASHSYKVILNNNAIAQHDIWRDDCGLNNLYPQGGTWVYNRANWCPGAVVHPIYDKLPNVTGGTNYDISLKYEAYTVDSDYGSYASGATVFYFGDFNKNLDASIEDIIAPTTDPRYFRANPTGTMPQVLIRNGGATAIHSIDFNYGIKGETVHTFTWNGMLQPLADTVITFPKLLELTNMSINEDNGIHQFNVKITNVNGQADKDSTNNKMSSQFKVAPTWPGDIIIDFKTSNIVSRGTSAGIGNPNQKWVITSMNGNLIAKRDNTQSGTQYIDTVALPSAGMYKLTITTDNNMGLHWWPFDGSNQVIAGHLIVENLSGDKIPMKNYKYFGTAHDDWGAAYTQYFSVSEAGTVSVDDIDYGEVLNIYPNPAQNTLNIKLAHQPKQSVSIEIFNVLGQVVYSGHTVEQDVRISTKRLSSGVYTLRLFNPSTQKIVTQKVVIRK